MASMELPRMTAPRTTRGGGCIALFLCTLHNLAQLEANREAVRNVCGGPDRPLPSAPGKGGRPSALKGWGQRRGTGGLCPREKRALQRPEDGHGPGRTAVSLSERGCGAGRGSSEPPPLHVHYPRSVGLSQGHVRRCFSLLLFSRVESRIERQPLSNRARAAASFPPPASAGGPVSPSTSAPAAHTPHPHPHAHHHRLSDPSDLGSAHSIDGSAGSSKASWEVKCSFRLEHFPWSRPGWWGSPFVQLVWVPCGTDKKWPISGPQRFAAVLRLFCRTPRSVTCLSPWLVFCQRAGQLARRALNSRVSQAQGSREHDPEGPPRPCQSA